MTTAKKAADVSTAALSPREQELVTLISTSEKQGIAAFTASTIRKRLNWSRATFCRTRQKLVTNLVIAWVQRSKRGSEADYYSTSQPVGALAKLAESSSAPSPDDYGPPTTGGFRKCKFATKRPA